MRKASALEGRDRDHSAAGGLIHVYAVFVWAHRGVVSGGRADLEVGVAVSEEHAHLMAGQAVSQRLVGVVDVATFDT